MTVKLRRRLNILFHISIIVASLTSIGIAAVDLMEVLR